MRNRDFEAQLNVARRYVQQHAEAPAAQAAFQLAAQMMAYKASTVLSADIRLEQAFAIQRERGASPQEVVARCVAFYLWIDRRPGYFKNQRAEDVGLGRLCLHAEPLGGYRHGASVYAPAGRIVREHLGVFALALLRKIENDAARLTDLRAMSGALE